MPFFSRLLHHTILVIPFECATCKKWPSTAFEGVTGVCQSCIQMHAHAPLFPVPKGLDDCAAAVDFDAPWSALISRYKFAPEPGLGRLFAGLMRRESHILELLEDADIVIPLPLATERLEERGFNQALTLAKHLVKHKIDAFSLIRIRDTAPQRTLTYDARQGNVANAFALQAIPHKAFASTHTERHTSFEDQHIVLIDDVMTTGATLAAAAAPLYRAGAARVSAVVIARTPLNHNQPR